MTALDDAVIAAETSLIDPVVRRDRRELERLLDESFTEIGQSGRLWRRDEIIDALVTAPVDEYTGELPTPVDVSHHERAITETEVRLVTADTVLLTYLLRFDGTRSRRSSVWRVTPTTPPSTQAPPHAPALRMLFHQGTALLD